MKTKFNIKYIYLIAAVIFISCDDDLDFNDQDSLTQNQLFSTASTTEGGVLGLYSLAQNADAFNGTIQVQSEWQADNSEFKGSFPTFRQVFDYATQADNTSVDAYYTAHTDLIEACNLIITDLPQAEPRPEGLTPELEAQFIAEARFLRALTNFNLSMFFSQPYNIEGGNSLSIPNTLIPFRTFPDGSDNSDEFDIPRSTLNQIYDQIEDDLSIAVSDLPATYANVEDTRSRATSGAATALLARLELYRENFDLAAQLATDVINSPNYVLSEDFLFYNTFSSEHIFTIANLAVDSQDSNEGYSGLTNPTPGGRGDAPFSQNLVEAYESEPGDLRYTELTQIGVDAQGVESVFTSKYPDFQSQSDNAPIIRITEMYLIRAEANVRNNSTIGANPTDDINLLRERASLDALTSVDIDDVLRERRKELAFEGGHRRMDLLRNGRSLRRDNQLFQAESQPGQPLTILPFPQREIDLTTQLEQNPGY
jgi:hypothetical protein